MSKTEILTNTIKKLNRLDERSLKEASDFVDFLLYKLSDRKEIKVVFNDKTEKVFKSLELDVETSNVLFQRTNKINRIEVELDNIVR